MFVFDEAKAVSDAIIGSDIVIRDNLLKSLNDRPIKFMVLSSQGHEKEQKVVSWLDSAVNFLGKEGYIKEC